MHTVFQIRYIYYISQERHKCARVVYQVFRNSFDATYDLAQKYVRNTFVLLFSVNEQDLHVIGCPRILIVPSGNKALPGQMLTNMPLIIGTLGQYVIRPKWVRGTLQRSSRLPQKCISFAFLYLSRLDPTISLKHYWDIYIFRHIVHAQWHIIPCDGGSSAAHKYNVCLFTDIYPHFMPCLILRDCPCQVLKIVNVASCTSYKPALKVSKYGSCRV